MHAMSVEDYAPATTIRSVSQLTEGRVSELCCVLQVGQRFVYIYGDRSATGVRGRLALCPALWGPTTHCKAAMDVDLHEQMPLTMGGRASSMVWSSTESTTSRCLLTAPPRPLPSQLEVILATLICLFAASHDHPPASIFLQREMAGGLTPAITHFPGLQQGPHPGQAVGACKQAGAGEAQVAAAGPGGHHGGAADGQTRADAAAGRPGAQHPSHGSWPSAWISGHTRSLLGHCLDLNPVHAYTLGWLGAPHSGPNVVSVRRRVTCGCWTRCRPARRRPSCAATAPSS